MEKYQETTTGHKIKINGYSNKKRLVKKEKRKQEAELRNKAYSLLSGQEKINKIKNLVVFGCEVIFSSNFYQICAKNRAKANSINNYLIEEGFLDRFTKQNEYY